MHVDFGTHQQKWWKGKEDTIGKILFQLGLNRLPLVTPKNQDGIAMSHCLPLVTPKNQDGIAMSHAASVDALMKAPHCFDAFAKDWCKKNLWHDNASVHIRNCVAMINGHSNERLKQNERLKCKTMRGQVK